MIGVDVSDELKELLKVYTDAEEHLLNKEKCALESAESVMKRYLEVKEERKKVTEKLNVLKHKLSLGKEDKDEQDEDEDDNDD